MKVVISGGGSGGHLYPALEVAKALVKRGDDVLYLGAKGKIEEKLVPKANIPFIGLNVWGMKKSIKGISKFCYYQIKGLLQAKKIIKAFKPDVVVGWGGYASFPTLMAANQLKIPTLIHEQNALIGRANYILALKADKKLTCYQNVVKGELVVGNPRASEALKYKVEVKNEKKLVLFVMGSQGSSTVNKIIASYLNMRSRNYHVFIITGIGHLSLYDRANKDGVNIIEYSQEVLKLFNQADLIVTRGGATTLEELAVLGKPSIIVPSPYVYKNHQYHNAMYYQENQAAIVVEEKKLTDIKLKFLVEDLINDHKKLYLMGKNMLKCAHNQALQDILRIIDVYAKRT